jgi:predicted nucleic acid-binding Zn ribbon protein
MDAILPLVAREVNMPALIRRWKLHQIWETVVGANIAEKTEPDSIYDDVLTVRVSDSAWTYELTHMKEEIIEKLSDALSGRRLRDIRFYTGSIRPVQAKRKKKKKLAKVKVDYHRVLESMDLKALEGKPELRKTFESLILNTYRLQKTRGAKKKENKDD